MNSPAVRFGSRPDWLLRAVEAMRSDSSRRLGERPFLRTQFGFTLIELVMVIAIVAVLAGLLLPALSRAKGRAQRMACASNLKQFAVGMQLYAADGGDFLPPNQDGQDIPLGQTWVEGWLGLPGPDCTNTLLLRRSLLGRYVSDTKVWQCPSANRAVKVAAVAQPRVRTVSLNCFLGSPVESPSARTFLCLAEITQPSPSQTVAFLQERPDTINDGSFAMQWSFDEANPGSWVLRDKPEAAHDKGGKLSFSDGHVETRHWRDHRTVAASRDDIISPRNQDVLWLQQRATWHEPVHQ